MKQRRGFIYAAGQYTAEDLRLYKRIKHLEDDLILCADGGYDAISLNGIIPHAVIGDMDSVRGEIPDGILTVRYPSDKDKTDLEICMDYAISEGCTQIIMLGVLGGRLDHTIGALCAMRYALERGAAPLILHKGTCVYLIDGYMTLSRENYKHISLIPCTSSVEGVITKGLKYELDNAGLLQSESLGISNEFYNNTVEISVGEGLLFAVCTEE